MKQVILTLMMFIGFVAFGQETTTESTSETDITTSKEKTQRIQLGIRFGDNFSIDATLPFSKASRIHPNIMFGDGGVRLGAYLDWVWGVDQAHGLKLYPGVGPEFWFYNSFDIGVAGNFGAEYAFKFPLTVGIDWRPGMKFINYKFHTGNWGITARWRF